MVVDRSGASGQVCRGEVEASDPAAQSTDVEGLRAAHRELGELVAAVG